MEIVWNAGMIAALATVTVVIHISLEFSHRMNFIRRIRLYRKLATLSYRLRFGLVGASVRELAHGAREAGRHKSVLSFE